MRKPNGVLTLLLVGATATLALLFLFAYAPDLRNAQSSDSVAVSRSATGYAGLQALLRLSGIPSEIDRGPTVGALRPSLTIITPNGDTEESELREYRARGPLLVVLPKWTTRPIALRPAWVEKTGAFPVESLERLASPIARLRIKQWSGDTRNADLSPQISIPGLPRRLNGRLEHLQTATGAAPILWIGDKSRAILLRVRGGANPVYVLSEPDLLNNHGLGNESAARSAAAIIAALRQGKGPVMLDVTLNGLGRTNSPLKMLFEPPFRGATISAVLAALMMMFHALARFGAPQDGGQTTPRGKRALVNNSAALVRMMGREAGMAPRYVQAARDLVLARLGGRRRSLDEQNALLAAMEKRAGSPTRYDDLAAEAVTAKNNGDLLRIAIKTYAWRRRITGEH
jgi:hypothetical protein